MVTLCGTAVPKGKSWPEWHDRAITNGARMGCCLYFLYSECGWECMRAYLCVYAHTHTHCADDGVLGCEARSRDEACGGPKNAAGLNLG